MDADQQQAFEAKLAQLKPSPDQKGFCARLYDACLRCLWWICCCFCFATNPNKPETKQPWSVTSMDGHVARPAHLKISTSDNRAVEVKIVYAVNANMPSQLYEVDVFMFFLKDLEAVSNNFYHDLWQVARLHTPKIPLAALASDSSAGFTSLIQHELAFIASKQAEGASDSVQQQVDGIVQQLRLHVCIFRNSVRRALKGISQALERLEGGQAGAAGTVQVCRAVTTVVGQIAQSVHRLQQVCQPCEAADAPDAVKVVWQLVDEYTLMEAERAMLKLMRCLDKHLQHVQHATAVAQVNAASHPPAAAESGPVSHAGEAHGPDESLSHESPGDPLQTVQFDGASEMWNGPVAEQQTVTDDSTQLQAGQQGSLYSIPSRNPHQLPYPDMPNSPQQLSGITVDQQSDQLVASPAQRLSLDQQSRRITRDAGGQAGTKDIQQPHVTTPPASNGPVLVKASVASRKEKLEYRLSQDDVYSPTAAEVQALLQHGLLNTFQQQQYGISTESEAASNMRPEAPSNLQSNLNGVTDGGDSATGSVFANPLVNGSLPGSQLEAGVHQEEPNMLSLIAKIQDVQGAADSLDIASHAEDDQAEASLQVGATARQLIMEAVIQLQNERKRRGYKESILVPNDPGRNEKYTNRIKCLKHNARAAVVLRPQLLSQSFLLADLVGMTIAGLAMCLAVGAIYVATRFTRNQLSGAYVTIIVVGYMLKDRMKEWGKRYLQPAATKFGFEFPDRTVKMRDSRGKRVGRCKEWVKVVGDTEVDVRVLAMRHKDKGYIPPERQALKPERVLAYRKKMEVAWNQLDPRLRGVDGLDDIMRFDLQHFCRRMQPPNEPHYSLERAEDGSMQVQKVECARVYHINVVLRIRTSLQDTRKDKAYKEKSLQIQRARIVMDQTGIKRLEATDDSVHLMANRHAVTPGPAWHPDVRVPGVRLPKLSMMRMPTFGRHPTSPVALSEANNQHATTLPEVRTAVQNPEKELIESV